MGPGSTSCNQPDLPVYTTSSTCQFSLKRDYAASFPFVYLRLIALTLEIRNQSPILSSAVTLVKDWLAKLSHKLIQGGRSLSLCSWRNIIACKNKWKDTKWAQKSLPVHAEAPMWSPTSEVKKTYLRGCLCILANGSNKCTKLLYKMKWLHQQVLRFSSFVSSWLYHMLSLN